MPERVRRDFLLAFLLATVAASTHSGSQNHEDTGLDTPAHYTSTRATRRAACDWQRPCQNCRLATVSASFKLLAEHHHCVQPRAPCAPI
jgi:hypothetical protein